VTTFRAAAALAALLAAPGTPARAEHLDLSGYVQTFADEFKTLDISAWGPGTRWIAHTPWHGDFGDAVFGDPAPEGPFSTTPEGLRITAARTSDGRWVSGLISSMDREGPDQQGFAQRYGYFEMTARLPEGKGTWPAFWLIGADKRASTAEIDVIEFYGHDPSTFHSVQHIWVAGKDRYARGHITEVTPHLLADRPNSFGVRITPETVTFFLNRESFWSTPTAPEYRQPMYMLANLALGSGWPVDLPGPVHMDIASIRVFQSKTLMAPGNDHAGP
jgi:beta-glucanase (GH16 family)